MGISVSRGAISNFLQAVANLLVLLIFYRYVLSRLGSEQFGVWSITLAAVSSARLADLGISASVTRFVAVEQQENNNIRASRVIDTATTLVAVIIGAVALISYPLIAKLSSLVLSETNTELSIQILPYALASLWFSSLASVSQGALDGCRRMDVRSILFVSGQIILLPLSILLIPRYGLLGLAVAQALQSLYLFVAFRLAVSKLFPKAHFFKIAISASLVKKLLAYGGNFQLASVAMLLFDMTAKLLISKFSGPAPVGYFEIINSSVVKIRSIMVSANQSIVPYIASMSIDNVAAVRDFYTRNMSILFFFSMPVFSFLICASPGLSDLLIGSKERSPSFMIIALAVGWFLNTLACPAYFINLGSGTLTPNTISHIAIGVINLSSGLVLGHFYGWTGVVLAYSISLSIGSILLTCFFISFYHLATKDWIAIFLNERHTWLYLLLIASFAFIDCLTEAFNILPSASIFIYAPVIALLAWTDPLRPSIMSKTFI
jgi:O-antigen/teichoic acid export membrane protein